ncbi:hypothetical protein EU537_11935 [Candidatus Thorarchaeota archaeon]|nr:MAG: hypothetical protein EU537_11935 [Candidatus Thorarchaeota archaeon]
MNELNRREDSSSTSSTLLKIRQEALGKAFNEIGKRRFELDEKLDNGWISKEDYQKDLLKLILESREIRDKQQEINEKLGLG